MIMTTKEAAKKWCPFARVAIAPQLPACNRIAEGLADGALPPQAACIHENCMAWVWVYKAVPYGEPTPAPTKGFCGLAAPEQP